MFAFVVLTCVVGILVCQNCIGGLPFSVCWGCSVSKGMETVLVDSFCGKPASTMALVAFSSSECKMQNKEAVIVLRTVVTETSC